MAIGLGEASQGPAKIAEDLPVCQGNWIDLPAARFLIGLDELSAAGDTGEAEAVIAKTPVPDEGPRQVFMGIADGGELPVEDGAQATRSNQDVAQAKIP